MPLFCSFNDFFGPNWLCHLWQVADFAASTISLYSICAIALDRFWNLEKPLRVLKRSRRIAYRLIIAIWIVPFAIWTVVYYALNAELFDLSNSSSLSCSHFNDTTSNIIHDRRLKVNRCCADWIKNYTPVLIAIPVMYIPVIILITIFVRIAVIVQHHMKFLSANANNNVSSNCFGYPEFGPLINSNWNSRGTRGSCTKLIDEQHKATESSIATVTSVALRTPPSCLSPRSTKRSWNLAPLTEEKSNGLERSRSEQIQPTEEIHKFRKKGNSIGSCVIQSSLFVPSVRQSLQNSELLSVDRHNECVKKTTSEDNFFVPHIRYNWIRSSLYSTELTLTTRAQSIDSRKTSRISMRSKRESRRFSIIPLPHNIFELIHREGVLQQIRAAKTVAIILFCFLLCWSPFLILWPIKMYCSKCIPDQIYMVSIWLNYIGSALNPVVYTLSSPRARVALRQYLKQRSSFRWKHKIFKRITML
uniref:G_PROTEIN_RECEP_F1_2 domain-containing protein n=1 Tax=Syphacia muris TaxID=451379 RepID=A0A0N5AH14_9BILA